MRFSANLGFLWTDLALTDAVHAAARAGFAAVECHWPYETPPRQLCAALSETGLPLLGINTIRGEGFGLSALPDQAAQARAAIDQALDYAARAGAAAVHVMAGNASGPQADRAFRAALRYAADRAAPLGITILIEPLNPHDAPGYFLRDTAQAVNILRDLGRDNLALMFDCYHVARTEGDVIDRLRDTLPWIGHVQFAGVPDRGRPDHGTLDYRAVFDALRAAGWTRPPGAEYRPDGATDASLGWMRSFG